MGVDERTPRSVASRCLGVGRLLVFGEVFNEGIRFAVITFHFPPGCPRVHFPRSQEIPGDGHIEFLAACHPRCIRSVVVGRKL